jgi:hypothetical protein
MSLTNDVREPRCGHPCTIILDWRYSVNTSGVIAVVEWAELEKKYYLYIEHVEFFLNSPICLSRIRFFGTGEI